MRNYFKQKKGITLIALVITIIVLLILAGISISMLSGDNSILLKATQSKEKTERSEIIENAKLDILAKITEKKGENLTPSELEEILTSSNYNTQGRLSDEESILDRTLTSNNGKYQIPVSEIYNGSLSNTTPSVATDYSNEVKTALEEGKYVTYKNKPYVVLYNNDDGIEIIAMELMGTVTLGKDDESDGAQGVKGEFSRAQWSYNNAIQSLNKATEKLFPSDSIVDDARCVGSQPGKTNGVSNKNIKNDTPYVHGSNNSYFSDYDSQFEQGESVNENNTKIVDIPNYTTDLNKMKTLGIEIMDDNYWIASRYIHVSTGYLTRTDVSVYEIDGEGFPSGSSMITINSDGTSSVSEWENSSQLRPVLHLAFSAKIKNDGGDGSSIKPFVLE